MKKLSLILVFLAFVTSCSANSFFQYRKDVLLDQNVQAKFYISDIRINIQDRKSAFIPFLPKFMKDDFSSYPDSAQLSKKFHRILEDKLKAADLYSDNKNNPQTFAIAFDFKNYQRVPSFLKGNAYAFFMGDYKFSIFKNNEEIAFNECVNCRLVGSFKEVKQGNRVFFMTGGVEEEMEDLNSLAEIFVSKLRNFGIYQ